MALWIDRFVIGTDVLNHDRKERTFSQVLQRELEEQGSPDE